MSKFYQTLIFHRIKKVLSNRNLATYKLQKNDIIFRLNDYFWDKANGMNGFWNKRIYKNQIDFYSDAIKQNGHTIQSCRTNLADNLNIRTEELITHLINQDMLRSDNDMPPSYYIVGISVWRFFVLFKWIFVQVIFLGLVVGIFANLISSYIWQTLLQR